MSVIDDMNKRNIAIAPKPIATSQHVSPASTPSQQHAAIDLPEAIEMPMDPRYPDLILQPSSRPISVEQLTLEVKSIYSGLTLVENKCIQVDQAQVAASARGPVPPDHWRAMISLHRKLLHEHHDFFLASQHPAANPGLKRLAGKHNMPARMWKHGIQSFLELLRHQLPQSREFMVAFIILAYQMLCLLYETVPSFKDTWIECLGDLARYRMAIEEEDPQTREIWAGVARSWYGKAANRMPETGRLYHHLAILARPHPLQQLYLYGRSLISAQPFPAARESIEVLFNPTLAKSSASGDLKDPEQNFVIGHAYHFQLKFDQVKEPMQKFISSLPEHIDNLGSRFREFGAQYAIANLAALQNYGNNQILRRLFEIGNYLSPFPNLSQGMNSEGFARLKTMLPVDMDSDLALGNASFFTFSIFEIVLKRQKDRNGDAHVHVMLSFILALASYLHRFESFLPSNYVSNVIGLTPWALIW
jgi:hypothetical protein